MSGNLKNLAIWLFIFLAFIIVANQLANTDRPDKLHLSKVLELGKIGDAGTDVSIVEVKDRGGRLEGKYINDQGQERPFESEYIVGSGQGRDILKWAVDNNINYLAKKDNEMLGQFFLSCVLLVGSLLLIFFFMRHLQGGGGANKAMSFGKSRAKLFTEGQTKVSFDDVAGIEEVKEELLEIIQFLKDPTKFSRLGGKIPTGALLYGAPGTGKTLIARATACEADVPFFSISGSDFVEMFVGVGASRVRDLFEQGKRAAPCLIYIDEIDAVGRKRGHGHGGGHDEREQTLNQLLVELDGFAPNSGIIVMASTNRPDVLDPALLRPGRFDRQINVSLPDIKGREKILSVHTRDLKINDAISLKQIARGTPGFSGADLANLCNEAALMAARLDKEEIEMSDLEEAKDRVMMGPERRSLVMSETERTNTAFHEAGHALVSKLTPDSFDDVHKVTIMPRGRSLGLTAILPTEDRLCETKQQMINSLLCLMGGRAAEELKFDEYTTGASNDLKRATEIARRMICEFGMSENLGPVTFGQNGNNLFLAEAMMTQEKGYSEETARIIDQEIRDLVTGSYTKAKQMISENMDKLEAISLALLDRETVDGAELEMLMRGEQLPALVLDDDSDSSGQSEEESNDVQKNAEEDKEKHAPPPFGLESPGRA